MHKLLLICTLKYTKNGEHMLIPIFNNVIKNYLKALSLMLFEILKSISEFITSTSTNHFIKSVFLNNQLLQFKLGIFYFSMNQS